MTSIVCNLFLFVYHYDSNSVRLSHNNGKGSSGHMDKEGTTVFFIKSSN